jgi:hypothetical protein
MAIAPDQIPRIEIPLHTLIELTPLPDGTMTMNCFPVDIHANLDNQLAALSKHVTHSAQPAGGTR